MRRADFSRAEQACRRCVAQAPKLSQDGLEAESNMAGDIFEKDPFGGTFPDDAGDLGPEVAGIVGTAALSCGAERLAGVSGEDGIEGAAEGASIEAAEVIPDRGRGEIPCALGGDEDGAGPVLPFDEGAGVETGLCKHDAHIQASAACAEGQAVPGT